ncbi:MAG TPA: serine/threonine-protein kinase, partial [Pirellulales bacterium]|nr:serine/threonine-protein kinase [Pirellulales bacterium]
MAVDPCPTRESLEQLIGDGLAARDRSVVESHVQSCTGCQETLEQITDGPLLGAPTAPQVATPFELSGTWGEFRIVRELGRGGMGVVYEAYQGTLKRHVALKILPDRGDAARFSREAKAAGRLHHTNIVPVFGVGENQGRAFYVMQYIAGRGLDFVLKERADAANKSGSAARLNDRETARIGVQVAEALAYAHAQGVIHRDIKPSNLLLDEQGTVWVTDFGLAHDASDSHALTHTGDFMGTLQYVSPERIGGRGDHRADLYGLGVTLYELVCGRPAHGNSDQAALIHDILNKEPVAPRQLERRIARDLETIILKAMAREPAHRYASAGALGEDLRRFLEDRPVHARRARIWERAARWSRRNKVVAGLLAALWLVFIAGFAAVTVQWRRADAEKQAALQQAYRASLAAASAALENHDVADAQRHLDDAPEALRGWEWGHLRSRLDDSFAVVRLPAAERASLIAAADRLRVGVLTSAGLRISDVEQRVDSPTSTLEPARFLPRGPERRWALTKVNQTSRGLRVAAWVDDTAFDLLDERAQVLCRVRPKTDRAEGREVVVSPDGTRLVLGVELGGKHTLALFETNSGKQTAICSGHDNEIWAYTFSPDSS